jgi:hypothetical protein
MLAFLCLQFKYVDILTVGNLDVGHWNVAPPFTNNAATEAAVVAASFLPQPHLAAKHLATGAEPLDRLSSPGAVILYPYFL